MVAPAYWSTSNFPIVWNAKVPRAGIETGGVGRAQLCLVQALLLESSCRRLENLLLGFSGLSMALRPGYAAGGQHACAGLAYLLVAERGPVPLSFHGGWTRESPRDPHPGGTRLVLLRLAEREIFQSDFCGAFASICAEQMDVKNRTDVRTETRMWQEEVQERERFIQTDPSLAAVCVARAAVLVRTGGLNCLRWRLGDQRLLHSTQVWWQHPQQLRRQVIISWSSHNFFTSLLSWVLHNFCNQIMNCALQSGFWRT